MQRLLVVEDEAVNVMLIKRALKRISIAHQLSVVPDGEEALKHLHNAMSGERPTFILLDLNLPRLSGQELLQRIRELPGGWDIKVAIFSHSSANEDVQGCLRLGADAFFEKPKNLNGYYTLVDTLEAYWLGSGELPRVLKGS